MKVKKIWTRIFVVVVNFYLLTFFAGIFLVFWTTFIGPLHKWVSVSTVLASLLVCVFYQFTRFRWNKRTIGEVIIGSVSKENILLQSSPFVFTRIPIFLLVVLTLVLNGNMHDGLSEGQTYGLGAVFSSGLVFSCVYYGLKNFFTKPEMLPVFLIASSLFLAGFIHDYSFKVSQLGNFMSKIQFGLVMIWILMGFFYSNKIKSV